MSAAPLPASEFLPLVEALATGSPEAAFAAAEDFCRRHVGFQLLTILRNRPETGEIERVHSTNLTVYPLGARKAMGGTPWGRHVLDRGEAWLGNGAEAILWAYPDAQLTLSMGREASLCVPVRLGGRTLGLLSMSAEKDRYNATDLANLKLVAALLAPAMERAGAA